MITSLNFTVFAGTPLDYVLGHFSSEPHWEITKAPLHAEASKLKVDHADSVYYKYASMPEYAGTDAVELTNLHGQQFNELTDSVTRIIFDVKQR